jgi:hypothetical protein
VRRQALNISSLEEVALAAAQIQSLSTSRLIITNNLTPVAAAVQAHTELRQDFLLVRELATRSQLVAAVAGH